MRFAEAPPHLSAIRNPQSAIPWMHFDNPIVLFIIIAVTLFRWLAKRSDQGGDEPKRPVTPNDPVRRHKNGETEEERIRQFLEALGQPAGSKPPTRVTPKRPRPTPRPIIVPPIPRLTTVPPPVPPIPVANFDEPLPAPFPVQQTTLVSEPIQQNAFEVRDPSPPAAKVLPATREARRPASTPGVYALKFGSAQDLRNAIVLREILGPPRSLQPIDTLT